MCGLRRLTLPCLPLPVCVAQAYANSLVDFHLILDLLPALTACYFAGRLPATLSYGQAAIMLMMGLQLRELGEVEQELNLPSNQVRVGWWPGQARPGGVAGGCDRR